MMSRRHPPIPPIPRWLRGLAWAQQVLEQQRNSTAIQAQIRAIQVDALAQLQQLNAQLQQLFLSSRQVQDSLHLPVPVAVVQLPPGAAPVPQAAVQQGGFVHAQMGGLVQKQLPQNEEVVSMLHAQTGGAVFTYVNTSPYGETSSNPLVHMSAQNPPYWNSAIAPVQKYLGQAIHVS